MLKEYIIYGLIGLLTGIFYFGGVKKEKEKISSFLNFIRNILIGFLLGILLFTLLNFYKIYNINYGLFFVFLFGFERLFIRAIGRLFEEDEIECKKNTLTYDYESIGSSYIFKIFIGVVFLLLIFLLFYLPVFLPIELDSKIFNGIVWGGIAGLIGSGIRGAWKHSKKYGFDFIRFFRSPLIAALFGGFFGIFTSSTSFLIFVCIGAERMTVDLYKRFFNKNSEEYLMDNKKDVRRKRIIIETAKWIVFAGLFIAGLF